MYQEFFGLKELPFSIAPDPRYLYMSERHREALAHLLYGVSGQGGFVVLTGEVGTGKTTICRCFLNQVPKNTDAAFVVNPKLSARELMASVCDEFHIQYPPSASIKVLNDLINKYLLQAHAQGRHTVLIIDEAQNLRVDVLEQLRLLTNLETSEKKLLQIVLLGQPELRELLSRRELRQLSQRITARYHLSELNKAEVGAYIQCRMSVAGRKTRAFTPKAVAALYRASGGVPRLINLFADRALLGAYANHDEMVDRPHVRNAVKEIKGDDIKPIRTFKISSKLAPATIVGVAIGFSIFMILDRLNQRELVIVNPDSNIVSESVNASYENQARAEDLDTLSMASKPSAAASSQDVGRKGAIDRSNVPSNFRPYVQNLNLLESSANSKAIAYKDVFARWGLGYDANPRALACEFAENNGLRCMHKNGSWHSLVSLNRPAVLTLIKEDGKTIHVALLKQEGEYLNLAYLGNTFWTHKNAIDQIWYGEYSIVWKLPPYKSRIIVPGAVHKEDEWLESRLGIVRNKWLARGESSDWNRPLKDKVIWFQRQVGLVPDGIVGGRTIIHLNSHLSTSYPRLFSEVEEG